jgi:hypothetical protein
LQWAGTSQDSRVFNESIIITDPCVNTEILSVEILSLETIIGYSVSSEESYKLTDSVSDAIEIKEFCGPIEKVFSIDGKQTDLLKQDDGGYIVFDPALG